ncbi:MAG TPA: hypothetical protein HA257_00760 [Candidatus Methanoperedenaceae archaeon]|nr:hypothetical protein [Candidatus Methanoperedenaceae archaeon]
MTEKRPNGMFYKTVIIWFTLLILGSFAASVHTRYEPVTITAMPEVPREGAPIQITFDVKNPSASDDVASYELYANGVSLMQGQALLAPESSKRYTYLYPDAPAPGDRITFLVKTNSGQGSHKKSLDLPAYPPQVWSSFVSFASFSTSVMSSSTYISSKNSMNSLAYYAERLGTNNSLNAGLIFSIVLILLLIYLELTGPLEDKLHATLFGLKIRFSRLSAVLFIIFTGMVFTKVAMIIG